MMPEWHQLISMSGHVKVSETAKILQLYATFIFHVHSFVCQLDYHGKYKGHVFPKQPGQTLGYGFQVVIGFDH